MRWQRVCGGENSRSVWRHSQLGWYRTGADLSGADLTGADLTGADLSEADLSGAELSGGELKWTDGMLYPVLHRLERQGLLASHWVTADSGRRRKYYKLQRAGRRALAEERRQWLVVHQALAALWSDTPEAEAGGR